MVARLDARVIGWLQGLESPTMTAIMRLITHIGSPTAVTLFALFAVGGLFAYGHPRSALALMFSVGGCVILVESLKRLLRRPRPDAVYLTSAPGYSLPSGHAAGAVAFYGVLALLLIRLLLPGGWQRLLAALGSGLLIFLIGLSRIYLRVHYPSDVLAGFALGSGWATLCLWLTERA